MNSKLIKGGLAGVAVVALAAGSTTFAAWSDFDTLTGSQAGADQLSLVLGEPNSQNFDNMRLAPGVGGDYEFVVASRQGDTIPLAKLSLALTNLAGVEDGCTSENSEAATGDDCTNTAGPGDFIDEARIIINASNPTTDPNACSSAYPRGARQGVISLRDLRDNTAATPVTIGNLAPGEYVCVSMGLNMPVTASNASQGDSASFDLKFLLDQVV